MGVRRLIHVILAQEHAARRDQDNQDADDDYGPSNIARHDITPWLIGG